MRQCLDTPILAIEQSLSEGPEDLCVFYRQIFVVVNSRCSKIFQKIERDNSMSTAADNVGKYVNVTY